MQNIFAGYGKIVTGELYIHRESLEKELKNRTLNYDVYGSVSIVGMQRMGKSSLVYNTLISEAEHYYSKGIIIVSCSMNNFATPESFFKGMIDIIYEEFENHEDIDMKIERKYNKIRELQLEDGGIKNIQSFFKLIKKLGKRVILVIDEFDHSRKLFDKYPEGFNVLRELAYQPETNVTFIFVSRRMITELESVAEISTLANILGKPIYVKNYSDNELIEYFNRNKNYGIEISEEDKLKIVNITGAQPYWMDILMYHYIEAKDSKKDFESIFNETNGVLYSEYERFMILLDEQHLLNKLYQIVIGPAYDYSKADVQKLYNYGIIDILNGEAVLNSENFYEYIRMKESIFNFYPLWNKTERGLRNLLKSKLKEKYGEDWEEKIKSKYIMPDNHQMSLGGYLKSALELKIRVEKQKDLYKQNVSYSIIETLTTAGLFTFYIKEYALFQSIFEMDKNEFNKISNHLIRARNPYQHNNDDLIEPAFKNITKGYCELLNKKINYFEDTKITEFQKS
jgi:hypothetical protein